MEKNHKTRSNLRGENDWGGGRSDRVVPVFYLILIQPDQRSKEQNYEFYVTTNACFDSSYNIVPITKTRRWRTKMSRNANFSGIRHRHFRSSIHEAPHSGLKYQKCEINSMTPCDLCQYTRFLIQINISFQFFIFSQSIGRYIHICIIFILKKHIGRTS